MKQNNVKKISRYLLPVLLRGQIYALRDHPGLLHLLLAHLVAGLENATIVFCLYTVKRGDNY